MILTFKVFKEKIENGEKCQSIRQCNVKRYRMFKNAKKYQLYWHNPRNGGKLINEVDPEEKPIRFFFREPVAGSDYITVHGSTSFDDERLNKLYPTDKDFARADGFDTYAEMIAWFLKEYGKDMMRPTEFMIIRWK